MKKQWAFIVLAVLLFTLSESTANATQKRSGSTAASRKTREPDLGNVAQFKDTFQNDQGRIRLVALISPT
jgi:hypothetical protein